MKLSGLRILLSFFILIFNYKAFASNKNFAKAINLIEKEDTKNLKYLLSRYPSLLFKFDKENKNLLHIAIDKDKKRAVKLLLVQGFTNIYRRDKSGLSPLDYEIFKLLINKSPGKLKSSILKNLVSEGAKLNKLDKNGLAPIHLAVIHNNIKLIKLLIKYSIDINSRDKDGWTALHWAVLLGLSDIIIFLINSNASVKVKNHNGLRAWDLVKYSEYYDKCFKAFSLLKLKTIN